MPDCNAGEQGSIPTSGWLLLLVMLWLQEPRAEPGLGGDCNQHPVGASYLAGGGVEWEAGGG